MIYIHAIGIHDTTPEGELPDLDGTLKELCGVNYRRIDHFIRLAIIGAHKAVSDRDLAPDTAIYIASGQGNISVFDRVHTQHHIHRMLPKPVDFINLLGNSSGFYVAQHLGLCGKNLFLTHHRFPVQMTMLVALNDLALGKQKAGLVGGVDEWVAKQTLAKRLLGVNDNTTLGEGSNWLLLSREKKGAIATFLLHPRIMDRETMLDSVREQARDGSKITFSIRFADEEIDQVLATTGNCTRHEYDRSTGYYETKPLYVLNSFLASETGRLVHLDVCGGQYMMMAVDNSEPAIVKT